MSRSGHADQPDLDSAEHIRQFVAAFYRRLLADSTLAPYFVDTARIDLAEHLPRICAYWEKMLLGHDVYRRHTMNLHRAVHAQRPVNSDAFGCWLGYFNDTLDEYFAGPYCERARYLAAKIADNMRAGLHAGGKQEDTP